MGEAKRRKRDSFSPEQHKELERAVEVAYRRTRVGIASARTAPDAAAKSDVIAAIHDETAGLIGTLTEEFFAADHEGPATRARIACKRGCSHCCHANVEVTIVEAIAVARRVAGDVRLRARVIAGAPRVDGIPPWTRFDLRIPCALLGDDGACSIYDVRPRVCRAHVSYDVKLCEEVLTSGNSRALGPMVTFGWPRMVSKAVAHGTTAALQHERLQACTVEMTAAVDLLLRTADAVPRWLGGSPVFADYGAARTSGVPMLRHEM